MDFPHPQTEQIPEWIWSSVGHTGHLVPREAFVQAHNKTVFSLSVISEFAIRITYFQNH